MTGTSARSELSRKVLIPSGNMILMLLPLQETKLPGDGPSKKHMEVLGEKFPVTRSCEQFRRAGQKSYAGTMFLFKDHLDPSASFPKIGRRTMDYEGRIITLEFDRFFLTQVYTPNAGENLDRLADRQVWDEKFADYLASLDKIKPVVAAGDFNVAHRELDLAHPDSNRQSAGFTDEERQGFSNLLARGFTDTFRYIHGDIAGVYTWWSQIVRTSKINNSGWRIDYWLVSNRIADKVIRSEVIDSGPRQDHAPILLDIEL